MNLHTFGVLCSLGILFAPFAHSASTCNNCNNIDCSQSFGSYNQCYRNCCPSNQCESSCQSNDCRANCQLSSCQNNCQTNECRSICQVSQCQSNCQSNLCKSNCEQNRCQSGSCNDYPRASPCSGNVPCDFSRPAPCSAPAPAPCASTTYPCPLSRVTVDGKSCTSPNITVNANPSISLPKITVNIHQGAVNVGPIHVQNNFTLSCGNRTAPCSRPPRVLEVRWPHLLPPPPLPPPSHPLPVIYPRWVPRPVPPQPNVNNPCCQYVENRCLNGVCYQQQVTGCGEQCMQSPQPVQQCPWYGCQQAVTDAPCLTEECQTVLLPTEQPQHPVDGSGYYDANYFQQQPQVNPQPVPAYPYPLPEILPQPYPESYPQIFPHPYPLPQPLPHPYPQPQPLPHSYPLPQPLPHPYPQPHHLPHPYPLPQPLPHPYPQPQPLPHPFLSPQPLPQGYAQPPQPLPQPYPYPQPQLKPVSQDTVPSNCVRIQQWPYLVCQPEPYVDPEPYQNGYADAYPGSYADPYLDSYAPSSPGYNNGYEATPNHTVGPNVATSGVTPVWSSLPGLLSLSTVPPLKETESPSEESFEYEDDQPESARSNVTST